MLQLKIARDLLTWIDASKGDDSRPTFIVKTLRKVMTNEETNESKATNRKAD